MNFVFFGNKKSMSEAYLGETRVSVTQITPLSMSVSQQKNQEKDGYESTQVTVAKSKRREIPSLSDKNLGDAINPLDVVKSGSILSIQGTTKGKGFAGVVKRWGFAGGFKTHGQSDRHRAPGSIGQGTTPGRVHKGKKMAGRMGSDSLTLKNILVVAVDGDSLWVKGPVPGSSNTLLRLTITSQGDEPKLTFLKGYSLAQPPTTEPAVESAVEPISEPTPEQVIEETSDQVVEPTTEPIVEQTPPTEEETK